MRDSLRISFIAFAFALTTPLPGDELRWSFDSLPTDSLAGDAVIAPIGPTGKDFRGMPDTNLALRLDGDGDYVRVEDTGDDSPLDFSLGDPITIEAWIRLDHIGSSSNVYIVGKGRTHLHGPRDNQNYALRLRGLGGQARLSFLFRSQADDEHDSDWHRWTSKHGMSADRTWHHVAVSYRFGDSKSIRGFIDGKQVSGSWDKGGETNRAPVVDNDELWIGSSIGGHANTSFSGAIDEVVIDRALASDSQFAKRRVVIVHPPQPPSQGLKPKQVTVSLFENVGSEKSWPVNLSSPLLRYQQSAFVFPRIPLPYGRGGVRRDWKGPVLMSAMAEVNLPAGETEWMVRAGGLSRLWIGDTIVLQTPAHLRATSGHGKVIPYPHEDPWLRPLRAGHCEETVSHKMDSAGPQVVTLETMIGGKDLRYEPGEIIVAFRNQPDHQWQILCLDRKLELTDDDWPHLAQEIDERVQSVDDRQRRRAASVDDKHWQQRHRRARQYAESLPAIEIPGTVESLETTDVIDRFINARIKASGKNVALTPLTSDRQFLRRLYLDCVGVIPSLQEIKEFDSTLGDDSTRRRILIDRVLEDPRWADHWTAYWMDVLAENPSVLKPSLNNSGPFRWYLYDVLRDNVAVDRWVTELLRMNGSVRGGGPAGFALATQNDVPMAAKAHIVSSAFLGANMKCARCHDAPYHDWTQKDLFRIAAMLAKKPVKVPATSSVPKEFFGGESDETLITLSVAPGEMIEAGWSLASYTSDAPLDESLMINPEDSREQLAAQLTRAENQQFARTIVNRLWARLMGEGIVDPVSDWEGARASHPQLLAYLARELTRNNYDFKHVARLILNSRAYQRSAVDRPVSRDADQRLFTSPRMKRMTAEQLVDSLHVAVGRRMDAGELTFDPEARMKPAAQANLGRPRRAWQLTSLSNERDRPALSLPKAEAMNECLEAFGWKGSRQEPINHRQTEPNVLQPGILASGLLSIQLTRLTDRDAVTADCLNAKTSGELIDDLFQRFLTRVPTDQERQSFTQVIEAGFASRVLSTPHLQTTPIREPHVSWANHLSSEATDIRLRESERMRLGPAPSRWLDNQWRQRVEDIVWALMNTPEFLFYR